MRDAQYPLFMVEWDNKFCIPAPVGIGSYPGWGPTGLMLFGTESAPALNHSNRQSYLLIPVPDWKHNFSGKIERAIAALCLVLQTSTGRIDLPIGLETRAETLTPTMAYANAQWHSCRCSLILMPKSTHTDIPGIWDIPMQTGLMHMVHSTDAGSSTAHYLQAVMPGPNHYRQCQCLLSFMPVHTTIHLGDTTN